MKMIITPEYSEIFEGEIPKLETLISGIPSELIISILCMINAKLYSGKQTIKVQIEIFNFLTHRQPEEMKLKLLNKVFERVDLDQQQPIEFFAVVYSLEFIHYELINYRDFTIVDTTPEQELNILKAYFLIVKRVNAKYSSAFEINNKLEGDFFRKATWPTLIAQVEANHNINYVPGMIKALAFFNFLEYHTIYSGYVKDFLKTHKKASSWNYVLDQVNLIVSSWDNYRNKETMFFPFSFSDAEGYNVLFEQFTLDIAEYQRHYKSSHKNFTGLKANPFFLTSGKNSRLVINWNFVTNKIYEGFLYDFYKYSGINKVKNFNGFIKFKRYLSFELVEKFIFRRLISEYFKGKYSVLLFDGEDGFPDCYCRKNNTIFLIEIKDSYFPSLTINSFSYSKIIEVIDEKFNRDDKGTGQLINCIKKIINCPYSSDNYFQNGIKNRNIIIYPIMIYTDKFFSMPGINNYLKEEFEKKLFENDLPKHFKNIKPITFINLNFLIDMVDRPEEIKIDTLIDNYNQKLLNRKKRFQRFHEEKDLFALNETFESISSETFGFILNNRENYIKKIIKTLNLTEGLF